MIIRALMALLLLPSLAFAQAPVVITQPPGTSPGATITGNIYNFCSLGAACDDSTDDTTALNTLLTTIYNARGGTLFVAKTAKISGAVLFPNNNLNVSDTPLTVTFSNGSAVINAANVYVAGNTVTLSTTSALPTNFATNTTYYVVSTGLSGSQFELAATSGGSPIVAGSTGSGVQTATGLPIQYPIRITGNGFTAGGALVNDAIAPQSALDLQNNATVAKLDTRGRGALEIDHIGLIDHGSDCAAFIQSTNTALHIHDVTFIGTAAGVSACNNGLVLGGSNVTSGIVLNGSATGAFSGYGTVIGSNFFYNTNVVVSFNNSANSVQVIANTVARSSGNQSGAGAAFDFGYSAQANYVVGNLVEVTAYKLAFHFQNGAGWNYLSGNQTWDPSGSTVASYGCDSGSTSQTLMAGFDNTVTTAEFGTCFAAFGNITLSSSNSNAYNRFPVLGTDTVQAAGAGTLNLGNTTNGPGFKVLDAGGTAANWVQMLGNTAGNAPQMGVSGSDTNINFLMLTKGTGSVLVRGGSDGNAFRVQTANGATNVFTANTSTNIATANNYGVNGNGTPLISSTAPTIASGFGSTPTVPSNNGASAFTINVGTGGAATAGVVTMPAAAHGWSCDAVDTTTPASFVEAVLPTSTTSITLNNYSRTTGLAIAWSASDVLAVKCLGY